MHLFHKKIGNWGKPMVIIHGLYGSSDNWMTIARKLSSTNQVFILDLRNHGKSPNTNEHTYNDLKNDIFDFFVDNNIKKATVLGHSMGGKVAMLFASKYPNLIERLIVADICPKNYSAFGENSHINQHKYILETLIELQYMHNDFSSRKELLDFLTSKLGSAQLAMFISKSLPWDREKNTFSTLLNANALYNNLDEIMSGVNASDFEEKLPITDYPVLFIRGLNSSYISDADIPEIMHIYPNAEIKGIENAGHWLHAEQPNAFLEIIEKFQIQTNNRNYTND